MRPKKAPGVKKEAFITAATELFREQGYAAVSVRNILDAVGDKSTSTGIFYYYFSSKEELYQECVRSVAEAYIAGFGEGLGKEGPDPAGQLAKYLQNIELSLMKYPRLILDETTANQLFILDMKERVTRRLIEEGKKFFLKAGLADEDNADYCSQFICGGIGEMIFCFRTSRLSGTGHVRDLTDHIAALSAGALSLTEDQKQQIGKELADWRENSAQARRYRVECRETCGT